MVTAILMCVAGLGQYQPQNFTETRNAHGTINTVASIQAPNGDKYHATEHGEYNPGCGRYDMTRTVRVTRASGETVEYSFYDGAYGPNLVSEFLTVDGDGHVISYGNTLYWADYGARHGSYACPYCITVVDWTTGIQAFFYLCPLHALRPYETSEYMPRGAGDLR